DERIVPIGIKQCRERVGFVMIDEAKVHVRTKPVLGDEPIETEQLPRLLAGASRQNGKVAAGPLGPGASAHRMVKVAREGKTQIVHRKDTADERNGVDVEA